MERRDWSLRALEELIYIDTLDEDLRATRLVSWVDNYLSEDNGIYNFDLELNDLLKLQEFLYKNISFLKKKKEKTRLQIIETQKMRRFVNNS
jgi:hypothetical protein